MSSFNPRECAESLRHRGVKRLGCTYPEQPESYFKGLWNERHPLNAPGPFYGAMTDTCGDGPMYAPASLLCDEHGQGFVWRQPRDESETYALLCGASSDPFAGYAWDGNEHWTPELVRDWWSQQQSDPTMVERLVEVDARPTPEPPNGLADRMLRRLRIGGHKPSEPILINSILASFLEYRSSRFAHYLREYLYFLDTGSYPAPANALPEL